jgi:hypothetical protein
MAKRKKTSNDIHWKPTNVPVEKIRYLHQKVEYLVGFVLLDLWFSVWCFVYHCLSFFFWPLHCLFIIHLRLPITPLGSSNFFRRSNIYIAEFPQRYVRLEPWLKSEKTYTVYVPGLILCLPFPMRKIPQNLFLLHHQDRDSVSFQYFVKSWIFTRNTPNIFVPPSARRNFFKCAPP